MSTITLEERVALLEQEVLTLKRQVSAPTATPWWEQISGIFGNVPAFDEASAFGQQYRAAQRPPADKEADVSP